MVACKWVALIGRHLGVPGGGREVDLDAHAAAQAPRVVELGLRMACIGGLPELGSGFSQAVRFKEVFRVDATRFGIARRGSRKLVFLDVFARRDAVRHSARSPL
jgi:hypothetical protein